MHLHFHLHLSESDCCHHTGSNLSRTSFYTCTGIVHTYCCQRIHGYQNSRKWQERPISQFQVIRGLLCWSIRKTEYSDTISDPNIFGYSDDPPNIVWLQESIESHSFIKIRIYRHIYYFSPEAEPRSFCRPDYTYERCPTVAGSTPINHEDPRILARITHFFECSSFLTVYESYPMG